MVSSRLDTPNVIERSTQFVGTSGAEVDAAEPLDDLGWVDDLHAYKCTKGV